MKKIETSKITLGTAQLGLKYGISNKIGKPNLNLIDKILKTATQNNIFSFDTAPDYGNSEEILGNYFNENKNNFEPTIVTKIPSIRHTNNQPTFDEVWDIVYKKINDAKFIAAHNASFDKNVLKECCNYYSIYFPRKKFVCTYRDISSKLWSFENNKLPTVCRHLRIPLDHHKGKSDAEACAKIVIKAFKEGWNYK